MKSQVKRTKIQKLKDNDKVSETNVADLQSQVDQLKKQLAELEERERVYQRSIRVLTTQTAATKLLAESNSFETLLVDLLELICENLKMDVGEFWCYDRSANVLVCDRVWRTSSPDLSEFEKISKEWRFSPGIGLPGRLLVSGKPDWIVDVTKDKNFPRAKLAEQAGLHCGFGFPIMIGDEVFGVMEFFTREIQLPDEQLLNFMANIGTQIGEFNWHHWHGDVPIQPYLY